jgi:hypothetical protein
MPTIANMPAADLDVTFASGQTRTVNMIRLLVQTQNAEIQAAHGMFLPGVGKLRPTVRALREAYELDYFYGAPVRTWKDAALVMRHFHSLCLAHVRASTIPVDRNEE